MPKAIVYCRVSTNRQVQEGVSLDNQEDRLKSYAQFKGFDNVTIIRDEGISGGRADRPGFVRLMDAVRNRTTDAVLVYSLSRFARNTLMTLNAVEVMRKKGVAFHSLTEQIDTTSAVGIFFLTTLAGLAELERGQIAERTRSAMQFIKKNGKRVGQIPFGQRLDDETGKLVPEVTEQQTLTLMQTYRKQGHSFSEIANALIREGRKNKKGIARWTKQGVYQLLNAN